MIQLATPVQKTDGKYFVEAIDGSVFCYRQEGYENIPTSVFTKGVEAYGCWDTHSYFHVDCIGAEFPRSEDRGSYDPLTDDFCKETTVLVKVQRIFLIKSDKEVTQTKRTPLVFWLAKKASE